MDLLDLFADESVSDILVNSTAPIVVEKSGQLIELDQKFESEQVVQDYAKQLFENNFERLDFSKPFAETTIQTDYGLVRVHASLGDQCSVGTQICFRRHSNHLTRLLDLQSVGCISSTQNALITEILKSRKNFVIVGSTGSGKTTLLRAMLNSVSAERIITIEDSLELDIRNSVSLHSRSANQEGFGGITLEKLVKEALRMRPDRIAVGESRGDELAVLLQAMNTGHAGTGFTLHANGVDEVVPRMLSLLARAGVSSSLGRAMIASSIDFILLMSRNPRELSLIEPLVIR